MTSNVLNIRIFSTYPISDASYRRRILPLSDFLVESGKHVEASSLFNDWMYRNRSRSKSHRVIIVFLLSMRMLSRIFQILRIRKSDCIIIHREIFPFFLPKIEFLALARAGMSILDFDDAIYTQPSRGRDWRSFLRNPGKFKDLVSRVDMVIVASPVLERWAKQYSLNVHLVLTLPPRRLQVSICEFPNRILWIGSDSGDIHLRSKCKALSDFAEDAGMIVQILSGRKMLGQTWPPRFEVELWSIEAENEALSTPFVGIMPLVDDEWSQGKGAYKLFQYMSVGMPIVASRSGVNAELIEQIKCGYIVDSDQEWLEGLKKMLSSITLFREFGDAGYEWITDKMTTQSYNFISAYLAKGEDDE